MTDQRGKKAFEILARENSRMLNVYLRSLVHDEAAIDDLFQETMVVAWRRLDECDLSLPFGPWMRGIASRLVMAHYRSLKRVPLALDESILNHVSESMEVIHSLPGDNWDEKVVALGQCVKSLPEKNHDAVRLRYLEDQPTKRVAESLGISIEACKKRLTRSRSMLADCLRRKGVLVAQGTA